MTVGGAGGFASGGNGGDGSISDAGGGNGLAYVSGGGGSSNLEASSGGNGGNGAVIISWLSVLSNVNHAPVLASIGDKTIPWGNLLTFTADALDQDAPAQTLTYSLIEELAGASIVLEPRVFEWTPAETQNNQSYFFKVRVTDNGINPDNFYDEEEITVTVAKRITMLVYGGDVSEQYSDQTDLSATLYDIKNGLPCAPISGKAVDFTIGIQYTDPDPITNGSGIASATLKLMQSPIPTYQVVATFAGDNFYEGDNEVVAFNIAQEDAITAYTGNEFVGEQNPDVSTTPLILSATVTDTDMGDSYRGDIRNAIVQFYDVNTQDTLSGWLIPGLVVPGDLTQGLVTHIWDTSVTTTGYNTFTIGVKVGTWNPENNGYYMGSDKAVVNVYRTDLYEFISGGGHIIPVNPKGEYASDSGRKVNFGFNVKWNKTMKRLQGNLNLVFRIGEKTYQIKTNAMNSLSINSINPCSQEAYFTSKANPTDVTLPEFPVEIKGNHTITAEYSGYANSSALSASLIQTVGSNLSISLTSSKNPEQVSTAVTFTAEVSSSGGAVVGVDVSFNVGGSYIETVATGTEGKAVLDHTFESTGNYLVEAKYGDQSASLTKAIKNKVKSVEIVTAVQDVPETTDLKIYPNPFNERLKFEFTVTETVHVRIDIYDITGRRVETLFNQTAEERVSYTAEFIPERVISAVYIYKVTFGDAQLVGKAIYNNRE